MTTRKLLTMVSSTIYFASITRWSRKRNQLASLFMEDSRSGVSILYDVMGSKFQEEIFQFIAHNLRISDGLLEVAFHLHTLSHAMDAIFHTAD